MCTLTFPAMDPASIPHGLAFFAIAGFQPVTIAVGVVAVAQGDACPTSLSAVKPANEIIAGAHGSPVRATA